MTVLGIDEDERSEFFSVVAGVIKVHWNAKAHAAFNLGIPKKTLKTLQMTCQSQLQKMCNRREDISKFKGKFMPLPVSLDDMTMLMTGTEEWTGTGSSYDVSVVSEKLVCSPPPSDAILFIPLYNYFLQLLFFWHFPSFLKSILAFYLFIYIFVIFLQYQLHYSARDELCRDLFHRLFGYTVGLINRSLHNGLQDKDIASLPRISIYRVPPKVSDTPTLTFILSTHSHSLALTHSHSHSPLSLTHAHSTSFILSTHSHSLAHSLTLSF